MAELVDALGSGSSRGFPVGVRVSPSAPHPIYNLHLIGQVFLFIVVPVLLLTLKVGVALAVPVAVLGAGIILIALLGKFIKLLIKKW